MLNNYDISISDVGMSVITLFSGWPYAERHWNASTDESKSAVTVWQHRTIALLEALPVLGLLFAIIERILVWVFASACFKKGGKSETDDIEDGTTSRPEKIDANETAHYLTQLLTQGGTVVAGGHGATVTSTVDFD